MKQSFTVRDMPIEERPRETFQVAIQRNATHIAVAHNHPSGDPQRSGYNSD